jgi:hypothetical protein
MLELPIKKDMSKDLFAQRRADHIFELYFCLVLFKDIWIVILVYFLFLLDEVVSYLVSVEHRAEVDVVVQDEVRREADRVPVGLEKDHELERPIGVVGVKEG